MQSCRMMCILVYYAVVLDFMIEHVSTYVSPLCSEPDVHTTNNGSNHRALELYLNG